MNKDYIIYILMIIIIIGFLNKKQYRNEGFDVFGAITTYLNKPLNNDTTASIDAVRSEAVIVSNSAKEKVIQAEMLYKYLEDINKELNTNETKQIVNKGNSIYKQIEATTTKIVDLHIKIQHGEKYDQLLEQKQNMMVEAGKIDIDIQALQELYSKAETLRGNVSDEGVEEEFKK